MKEIYIGNKDEEKYVSAAIFDLSRDDEIKILARGKTYIGKSINIARKLIRKLDLNYEIKIFDREYDDKELNKKRIVSEIEIKLFK